MKRAAAAAAAVCAAFSAAAGLPSEITDRIPAAETEGFELVYRAVVPGSGFPSYDIDNRADTPFDRFAYFFELVSLDGASTNWVWVSADKFTAGQSLEELAIPFGSATAGSPGRFKVSGATVRSNVETVTPGTGLNVFVEAWSGNYSEATDPGVEGGSSSLFDWNDAFDASTAGGGYGCFNFFQMNGTFTDGAALFAIGGWGSGGWSNTAIGPVPDPSIHPDWTFSQTAQYYSSRRLFALARPAADPDTRGFLRVMPIGDSITYGIGWEAGSGYRAVLRQMLADAGFRVDMVGDCADAPAGFADSSITPVPTSDAQHSGHSGWTVDQIREALPEWFRTVPDPHVVLLHIGTNDLGQHYDMKNLTDRYDALVGEIAAMQPSALIVVSTIMPRNEYYVDFNGGYIPQFNAALAARVEERKAAGARIALADMHSALSWPGDFPDYLHPNEAGYRKMAQAWKDAILGGIAPENFASPVENALAATDAQPAADGHSFTVWFNRPASETAQDVSHYAVVPASLAPVSATLSADGRSVEVALSAAIDRSENVSVTVSGVRSASGADEIVPRALEVSGAHGAAKHVPADEFGQYEQVYALDIPVVARYDQANGAPDYAVDAHAAWEAGSFDRIAYYMELEDARGRLTYAWVSMDAFTEDAAKIAVPTVMSGAIFQKSVANLVICSNARGVKSGVRAAGNIEFWPYNYGGASALGLPGAQGAFCDIDDTCSVDGNYGSMQIHDTENVVPLISWNCWGGYGQSGALGIGPALANNNNTDWTFKNNADSYARRRLEVYVRRGIVAAPAPQALSSKVAGAGDEIVVQFDSPVYDSEDLAAAFTVADGPAVVSARRAAGDPSRVILKLASPLAGGATVKMNGVCSDTASRTPGSGEIAAAYAATPMFPLVADSASTSGALAYSVTDSQTGRAEPATVGARLAWTHSGDVRMAGLEGAGLDASGAPLPPAVLGLRDTDLDMRGRTFTVATADSNGAGNGVLTLRNSTLSAATFLTSAGVASEIPAGRVELLDGSTLDADDLRLSSDVAQGRDAYGHVTNSIVVGERSVMKFGGNGISRYNGASGEIVFAGGKAVLKGAGRVFNPDGWSDNYGTTRYVVSNAEGADCTIETDYANVFYNPYWNDRNEFQLKLTGSIRKLGAGTLTLNAPNPPGLELGGIAVESGTVACRWNLAALPALRISVASGAALDISGASLEAVFADPEGGAGSVTAAGTPGELRVGEGATTATLSGALNISKTGDGVFSARSTGLSAANTTVSGGVLKLLPPEGAGRLWRKYRFRVTRTKMDDNADPQIMEFREIKLLDGDADVTRLATLEWDGTTAGLNGGAYGWYETPDKAVDGDLGTKLCDLRTYDQRDSWWIGFDFGVPARITGYKWANGDNSNRVPVDWVFEASMDGSAWTVLSEVSGYDRHGDAGTWVGDGEDGETFALSEVPHSLVYDLGEVSIAAGATLDVSGLGGEIRLSSVAGGGEVSWGSSALSPHDGLDIDLTAAPAAKTSRLRIDLSRPDSTVKRFDPAENGTLEIVGAGGESVKGRELPVLVASVPEGAAQVLKRWSVTVDGRCLGNARVVIQNGRLAVTPAPGIYVILR